ncbi:chemotaxis protein CheD [Neobacillus sp. D3-1R]|uniref:chemotaxis protein CheD n=1 Tax=Neobacillus sp. D3-1R TaxID=3445778 RepID=UPI003FA08F8D
MNDCMTVVKVGISDLKVVKSPLSIRTSGLGSCVGIVIYDQISKIAGLAHIMLPDSSLAKVGGMNIAKYADTAVDGLITQLTQSGALQSNLKSKIAGGAQMFQFSSASDIMRIGPRNVEAVKKELLKHRIPIVSEDVGGNCGRTIEFDTNTYMLEIRTVNKGIHFI